MSVALNIVRAIYDDVGRGDLAAVAARLDPRFLAEQDATLPFGGLWHGADGFSRMGAAILAAYPGFTVEPTAFRPSGSAVLVLTRVRAPAADGRPALDQPMIEFWRVEDCRAVECRPFYSDLAATAASAAGAAPRGG